MRLTTRYHLLLICVLLISLIIIGSTSYYILHQHAREEVVKQADVLMDAALAMRKYTIREIKPLLALQNKRNFLPQSVPSYAATQNFEALREKHSEYRYKEATLNPTNPRDRAMDWEADIIQEFRNNAGADHITMVRDNPLGATLYYARPIRISNESCLTCHGMIEDAPKTMIELYGPANGFGWKMNEVVGSQIVSVPISLPIQRANETFFVLMSIVVVVFLIIYLMLVYFFKKLFIEKSMPLATTAAAVHLDSDVIQDTSVAQDRISTQDKISTQERVSVRVGEEPISSGRNVTAEIPEYAVHPAKVDTGEIAGEHAHHFDQADAGEVPVDRTIHLDKKDADEIPADRTIHLDKTNSDEVPVDRTIHLDKTSSDAVTEERTIYLDKTDSEEIPEEYTISLEKMYQRVDPKASLLDEAFELEEAFTELTSGSIQDSGKT